MGLDMYLEKETYIGGQWQHNNVSGVIKIECQGKTIELDPKTITTINQDVGSWRKANQVHNFFVTQVQGGKDECQRSYVPNKVLINLREICKNILDCKNDFGADNETTQLIIKDCLPPSQGFFFGGTEIDEWYFADLEHTVELLKDIVIDKGDYYYQSSW
jgi:hypothetical protein